MSNLFDYIIVGDGSAGCVVVSRLTENKHLKSAGSCAWHQVGTRRLGHGAGAVGDDRFRVHGAERLRVIDASIMPKIICGDTNAPAIMIREKSTDMILEDSLQCRAMADAR